MVSIYVLWILFNSKRRENYKNELNKFNTNYKPIIINSISSDFNGKDMINCKLLLEYSFPNNPNIYYVCLKEKLEKKKN